VTDSCLNNFGPILGLNCYTLSPDFPWNSESTSPLLFWAFVNKTLHLGPFGYCYCGCSLDLGLGGFGPHFSKESAPLAPGPILGPGLSLGFNSRTFKSSAHVPADLVATRGLATKTTLHNMFNFSLSYSKFLAKFLAAII
jgi:hypothetical protein